MGYERDRGSSRQRGYDTDWDKLSRLFRARYPLCCGCEAMGIVEPATLVDHIEPHQGDRDKFWNEENWQACCDWHHNVVKKKLEQLWFDGAIRLADLSLKSRTATALSRQTPRKAAFVGVDGWPRG